jgi:hypothetical protein
VLGLGLVAGSAAWWSTRRHPAYTLGATERCLLSERRVLDYAEAGVDWIAGEAPGGGVLVGLFENEVVLGFERNHEDADEAAGEIETVTRRTSVVVSVRRNVFLEWGRQPTADERSAVEGCLRPGSATRVPEK